MSLTVSSEHGQVAQDRFMAVAFTQPWPELSDMPDWHQQLTIFPWASGDLEAMERTLEQFAPVIKPITAPVVEQADFADGHAQLPVWLLEPVPVLRGLHKVCLAILTNVASLENTTFTGENYTPQVTAYPHQPELASDDQLESKFLSLVQKIGYRRVIARTIELGDA